jgi:hypothetical protein
MIEDIIFSLDTFILEIPAGVGGSIASYSLDGSNYDYTETGGGGGEVYF